MKLTHVLLEMDGALWENSRTAEWNGVLYSISTILHDELGIYGTALDNDLEFRCSGMGMG